MSDSLAAALAASDAKPKVEISDVLVAASANLFELATRVAKMEKQLELKSHALDRYVPCADHRDKVDPDACYVCAAEKGIADTERLDWLEERLRDPRCVTLEGGPPAGLRTAPYWSVHLNGIGRQPHRTTVREAIDAAMSEYEK